MRSGGRPPTPALLKLVTGNPGHRPVPETEPAIHGPPVKPAWLTGRAAELWDEVVLLAFWLTAADSYMLSDWCELRAEREKPGEFLKWSASDKREYRAIGSELGLAQASRSRMAIVDPGAKFRRTAPPPDGSGASPERAARKYLD